MRLNDYSAIPDMLAERPDVEVAQLVEGERFVYVVFRPVASTKKPRRGRRLRLPRVVTVPHYCTGACP